MINYIFNFMELFFPYFAVIAFLFFANSVVNKIIILKRGINL